MPCRTAGAAGTREARGYNGGYIVVTYGSNNAKGIDAVQMEFGTRYRVNGVVDKSAEAAGKAIAAFYSAYLKTTPS